ncbi:MAG: DUF460 domain-containing protein [Candidatus Helarchaeota archaeon]
MVNISSFKKPIIYAGVDIEPMKSPLSRSPPTYALVICQDDSILFKKTNLRRRRVIKYLNEFHVSQLGIDNIYEFVKDNNELYKIIKNLPVGIKLIQITGNPAVPSTLRPLKLIAKQNQIKITPTNPLDTAMICIELIKKNIGYSVELFKDETKIVISTSKVPGHGGQSTNRYKRDLTGRVKNISREIQSILDKNNIDYDLSVRRSEYGLDYSHLLVYSDYKSVYRLIKPIFTPKIRIKIEPMKKNQIEYIPLKTQLNKSTKIKSLIVGIDPGINIGVAILDLNGNLLGLFSKKQISRNDLRKLIYNRYGIPVIVGTDVDRIPRFIEKFANTSQALIYYPKKILKVSEKIELINEYIKTHKPNKKVENNHERDALVSAIISYQFFKKRFEKAEVRLQEMDLKNKIDSDEVKKYIIKGYSIFDSISLSSSYLYNESNTEVEKSKSLITKIEDFDRKQQILENKIERLHNQNTILQNKLKRYRSEITELEKKNLEIDQLKSSIEILKDKQYIQLKKDRNIISLNNEISRLKSNLIQKDKEIKDLKIKLAEKNRKTIFLEEVNLKNKFYAIKIIPQFSLESIQSKSPYDKIVFIENISGGGSNTALELINKNVKCIIFESKICSKIPYDAEKIFLKNNIITIPADEFKIFKTDEYIFINRNLFDQIYRKWIKKQKEILLYEKERELSNILEDYRRERKKQVQ